MPVIDSEQGEKYVLFMVGKGPTFNVVNEIQLAWRNFINFKGPVIFAVQGYARNTYVDADSDLLHKFIITAGRGHSVESGHVAPKDCLEVQCRNS